MPALPHPKFKISLRANSYQEYADPQINVKEQGLRVGDIVRRQYYDGKNNIYTLLAVLEIGVDDIKETSADGSEVIVGKQPWFIGTLLEGQEPKSGEILDFVRITNLFDTDRSGALYLTASDNESPYMDVIDGIGRDCSLSWPEAIGNADPMSQYVVVGNGFIADYAESDGERKRVCRINKPTGSRADITQDFYQYLDDGSEIIVSFWAKTSFQRAITLKLSYTNDPSHTDGTGRIAVDSGWKYYVVPISVTGAARRLRSLTISLASVLAGEDFYISDFNIIPLSSVAKYWEASHIRVGRLSGIKDSVFGELDGYGGYFQKLFASQSAHISGTLTAADDEGFASTFYAGKIHKNAFVNSLSPTSDGRDVSDKQLLTTLGITNPTGVGKVIECGTQFSLVGQTNDWVKQKAGVFHTFSFWLYTECAAQITVSQNNNIIGFVEVTAEEACKWLRHKISFPIFGVEKGDMTLSFKTVWKEDNIDPDTSKALYFSAPQLEKGRNATQYQPTDDVLRCDCEDYGAWFSRGGLGGTIQNPMLRLNEDGSIQGRGDSLRLNPDSSGHFGKQAIRWNTLGEVTFGDKVKLTWNNLTDDVKQEIQSKSIKIQGVDTFTLLGDATGCDPISDPQCIILNLDEENIVSTNANRKWQYLDGYAWVDFPDGYNNNETLTIWPYNDSPDYWNSSNKLTVRCVVTIAGNEYKDTFTIRKQYITGYIIEITSSNGIGFRSESCVTTLTANVYYQGKLVDPEFCKEHYIFNWVKYDIIDGEKVEDEGFWEKEGVNRTSQQITLDYSISGSDLFSCELELADVFPFDFPIFF